MEILDKEFIETEIRKNVVVPAIQISVEFTCSAPLEIFMVKATMELKSGSMFSSLEKEFFFNKDCRRNQEARDRENGTEGKLKP